MGFAELTKQNKTMILIAVILLIVLAGALAFASGEEGFINKKEKAAEISSWFAGGGDSYNNYRQSVKNSDIVEYSKMRQIPRGTITPAAVETVLDKLE